jgi:hypothetical protein
MVVECPVVITVSLQVSPEFIIIAGSEQVTAEEVVEKIPLMHKAEVIINSFFIKDCP